MICFYVVSLENSVALSHVFTRFVLNLLKISWNMIEKDDLNAHSKSLLIAT